VSIQDERELAERLGGLLDGIEPRSAPLDATVRRGRGIRLRRRITAAVSLAVIAAGAVLIPAVLHSRAAPPPPTAPRHHHYTVTVNHLPAQARHGVIASGTQDGQRWQIAMSGTAGKSLVTITGVPNGSGPAPVGRHAAPDLGGEWGPTVPSETFGAVSTEVTELRLILVGGQVLDLRPVWWAGHPWVGVELPPGAHVARAVEYAGDRELAYSIPEPGSLGLDNWWLPGQVGPARYSKLIGSGVVDGQSWRYRAQIGPWGYCYVGTTSTTCPQTLAEQEPRAGARIAPMGCSTAGSPGRGPVYGLAGTSATVRRVVLRLSGGGTLGFPAVDVDGARIFAFAVAAGQHITSATAFGATGAKVWTVPWQFLGCGGLQ
jgi:hypothetical protein